MGNCKDRKSPESVTREAVPSRIHPDHAVRQLNGRLRRLKQMADRTDIWIDIIYRLLRFRT